MTSAGTATQRLASIKLGCDVTTWIAEHRANGLSYRLIVKRLAKATDDQIDVSETTIRGWDRRAQLTNERGAA